MRPPLSFEIDSPLLKKAFQIAIGDIAGNVQPWQGELDKQPLACLLAGLDYDRPWTRDAAFNAWYAVSLIAPTIARNTLMSVLKEDQWGIRIGGQYWDAIIWVTAAWNHYLCTNDTEFLQKAFQVSINSLHYFEDAEFDSEDNLFRGGACFMDGVSGYPDKFADVPGSGIFGWVRNNPPPDRMPGYGLPMKALSTNCLYYNAYRLLPPMADELQLPVNPEWIEKAQRLKKAINDRFWDTRRNIYRYFVDASDDTGRHEGLGHAFAILFGVANEDQRKAILENQHITPHGIPCVWPTYERYANQEGTSFGRHSGTIWPQVNAAWVMAASQCGRRDMALRELQSLAEKAYRDAQFSELYHPATGEIYGGLQEYSPGRIEEWYSCKRQTWCATGYIQMILTVLLGQRITPSGISYDPYLPPGIERMRLSGLYYRNATLSICVERSDDVLGTSVNGVPQKECFITSDSSGPQYISIKLSRMSDMTP